MLVIAAAMTSFYSWRLMFMTFWGKQRGDAHTHDHAHESPLTMLVPLGVLGLGAVFSGMVWYGSFFGNHEKMLSFFGMEQHQAEAMAEGEDHGTEAAAVEATTETGHAPAMHEGAPKGAIFMHPDNHVIEKAHESPAWVKVSPFIAMVLGFVLAWYFYIVNPAAPRRLAEVQPMLHRFLLNKWYFDEIYDALIVRPAFAIGRFLWKKGDMGVIDGSINGVAMGIIPFFTRLAGRAQSGYVFTYALAMVIGIVVLITWMAIGGGAE
jgi:NADH-quinone oxidoreductase subunit L